MNSVWHWTVPASCHWSPGCHGEPSGLMGEVQILVREMEECFSLPLWAPVRMTEDNQGSWPQGQTQGSFFFLLFPHPLATTFWCPDPQTVSTFTTKKKKRSNHGRSWHQVCVKISRYTLQIHTVLICQLHLNKARVHGRGTNWAASLYSQEGSKTMDGREGELQKKQFRDIRVGLRELSPTDIKGICSVHNRSRELG